MMIPKANSKRNKMKDGKQEDDLLKSSRRFQKQRAFGSVMMRNAVIRLIGIAKKVCKEGNRPVRVVEKNMAIVERK